MIAFAPLNRTHDPELRPLPRERVASTELGIPPVRGIGRGAPDAVTPIDSTVVVGTTMAGGQQ